MICFYLVILLNYFFLMFLVNIRGSFYIFIILIKYIYYFWDLFLKYFIKYCDRDVYNINMKYSGYLYFYYLK